ncbi:hypothetical protein [Streptomyces sp. NBC_01477]|uniref:hypothetical protein n=1 Tax=Streptomyces sp. NBC_01477 TaxID=2976015 RepID=UPI002E36B933|nr:hypothetical protein [Streptomyces sp. NBC_01477]
MPDVNSSPFHLPAPKDVQETWIDAVMATPGTNVPRAALEAIVPFIIRPKEMLKDPAPDGTRQVKSDRLRKVRTDAGEVLVAIVDMHGIGGAVWEHNERISATWRSVVDPAGAKNGTRTISRVRPWSRLTEGGEEKVLAALESRVANREHLIANIDAAVHALQARDGFRSYDLREDLILNGQVEPCMHVPQQFLLDEGPPEDIDGNPSYPDSYWGWMAVRGNNRTRYRHEIFEVTSSEVVTGVPFRKLGQDRDGLAVNPSYWLAQYSELLNAEYQTATENDEPVGRAHRAARVAIVESHLVIGTPTPQRLFRIVQGSNRRDHVHPPLEFAPNDRSRALGRSVLGAYTAGGVLDDEIADVLTGLAPITDLPDVPEGASVSALRDIRSMRLLIELFPTKAQSERRQLIQSALGEPPPYKMQLSDVNRRVRAWSALTSESYPNPWNPRVAEVFKRTSANDGVELTGRPLADLLATAESDDEAFEELLAYRAPHWLAAFDLIDADRGSLAGQKLDDEGAKADRVRRSIANSVNAMRNNRITAIALLREIADAMDQGDRPPLQIGDDGMPTANRATRAWFNRTFSKESGTRSYRKRAATDGIMSGEPISPASDAQVASTSAQASPNGTDQAGGATDAGESDTQALARLRREFERHILMLAEGVSELPEQLEDMSERAKAAGLDHAIGAQEANEWTLTVTRMLAQLRKIPEAIMSIGSLE